METTEAIEHEARRPGDILFVKHIEALVRMGWSPDRCQKAIHQFYDTFDVDLRSALDDFLNHHLQLTVAIVFW